MKTANISMFAAVLLCSFASRSPLRAQPADPGPAQPTSRGQTQPANPGQAQPGRPGQTQPTSPGRTRPASTNVSVQGDDKPWNRGVPLATREGARVVFLEGNRLFKVPLFAQAAEQYLAALTKWKHPAFYFNLAIAQLNLGQLKEVERQLGHIRVSCSTQGAEVSLDGETLFTAPGSHEAWVKATTHEITAKSPDYLSETRRVVFQPGDRKTLDLKLITLEEASEASRRWTVWKPWAIVGAGAVVTIAGGVLHTLASRNFSSFDSDFQKQPCAQDMHACPDRIPQSPAPSDLYARLDLARRERNIAVGSYVIGGSLLAAGAVLVYMNRTRLTEQEGRSSSTRQVTIAPVVSHDMLGIFVNVSH
ncbi:MAG: hypothetical protein E6J91_06335 [Deltaproteobacteria bacterium]|nr:MAG: hypothetical protein E6J91_06335 [Deltaproteobacteria bacterium]